MNRAKIMFISLLFAECYEGLVCRQSETFYLYSLYRSQKRSFSRGCEWLCSAFPRGTKGRESELNEALRAGESHPWRSAVPMFSFRFRASSVPVFLATGLLFGASSCCYLLSQQEVFHD